MGLTRLELEFRIASVGCGGRAIRNKRAIILTFSIYEVVIGEGGDFAEICTHDIFENAEVVGVVVVG